MSTKSQYNELSGYKLMLSDDEFERVFGEKYRHVEAKVLKTGSAHSIVKAAIMVALLNLATSIATSVLVIMAIDGHHPDKLLLVVVASLNVYTNVIRYLLYKYEAVEVRSLFLVASATRVLLLGYALVYALS